MTRAVEEHDYIGLSEVSSIKQTSEMSKSTLLKTSKSNFCEKPSKGLNLKATELRLGLPGLESPENGVYFSFEVPKTQFFGTARGFSEAINGDSITWGSPKTGGSEMCSLKNPVSLSSSSLGDDENLQSSHGSGQGVISQVPSKGQVVGWPPVRSFRKNSMAVGTSKNEDKDGKSETGCLYLKVSMDGAPYLRKVDLKMYGSYMELSAALEKMFSGLTIGQLGRQGEPGQDEDRQRRLADGVDRHSEYVVTYEDKDGDWMLVGDVPWDMFTDSCRRLRIIKSSEAIGLGSRAMVKLLP